MNFTFTTEIGDVDLFGELIGVGQYQDAIKGAEVLSLFGIPCRVASLDVIIRSKRAAGRPKDLNSLPELEGLQDCQSASESASRSKKPKAKKP
jgi:hypothetical protein